jgi:hypothetical protein
VTDQSNNNNSQEGLSTDSFAAFGNMWENWMKLAGDFPEGLQNITSALPGLDDSAGATKEAITIMAEYYRLAMMHGIQYWYFIAAKNMRFYPILAEKLARMSVEGQSSEARAECLDNIKAWMREMTDASNQETLKFQQEFENLIDDIWMSGLPEDETAEPKRRHKAKN